jgi:hypothetical protein
MMDKQILTTPILAAAWDRGSKSNLGASSKTIPPSGDSSTPRDTAATPQK